MPVSPPVYTPRLPARHTDLVIRGLRHRIHTWGDAQSPAIILLHGWVDTGMSFQFLADRLAERWYLLAPDWRGFGDTAWDPNGYWFPDYLADLDALLEHFSPATPARIVGHSMGGSVAWLYAGVRPARVSHVVSVDAAGIRDTDPEEAPDRYARWLDQLREPPAFSPIPDYGAALALVRKLASSLDAPRSEFLARQWVRRGPDGALRLPHDPRHKHVNPVLYRRSETRACWRRITARTLLVLARDGHVYGRWEDNLRADVTACLPHLETRVLDGGHMLHLERAEELAGILDEFLSAD